MSDAIEVIGLPNGFMKQTFDQFGIQSAGSPLLTDDAGVIIAAVRAICNDLANYQMKRIDENG